MATKKTTTVSKKKTTKKKTAKSVDKKTEKKKPSHKKKSPALWGLLGVLIVMAIIIAVALVLTLQETQDSRGVAATVNGVPIYQDSIDEQFNRLDPAMQLEVPKEEILKQSIDKLLVIQEAKNRGIIVTEEEVEARIEGLAATFGVSQEQLQEAIEAQNITYEEYFEAVREELILNRFVEEEIIVGIEISDEDAKEFYDENIESYSGLPGQRRVRHILVETEEEAWAIYDLVVDGGEDFATLAQEKSIGPSAPQGGDLGFVDEETPFVEEFKTVALSLYDGEVSVPVQTSFGWHVIKYDGDTIAFDDVKSDIVESLRQEEAQDTFQDLLVSLREEGDVRINSN